MTDAAGRPPSAAKEPAGELAAMSLNEAGYASLPPTGTYSPPASQQDFNENPTPTLPAFAPGYPPRYADEGSAQYVYYTLTPQMGHPPLPPPFSPVGQDGMGMGYGFDPMIQPETGLGGMEGGLGMIRPAMPIGSEMPTAFSSLPEAFDPSPPVQINRSQSTSSAADSWRKSVSSGTGSTGGAPSHRSNPGVYQPPHIQRMIEQQAQAQAQASAAAVASTLQHQPTHVGHPAIRMTLEPDHRPPSYGFQTLAENQMEWWQALPQPQMPPAVWEQGVAHGPMLGQPGGGSGQPRRGAYGSPERGGPGGGRGGFGGAWRGGDKRKEYGFNNYAPHVPYTPGPRYNSNGLAQTGPFGSNAMRPPSQQGALAQSYTFMSPAHPQRGMVGGAHLFGSQGAIAYEPQSSFGGAPGYAAVGAQRHGPQSAGYRSALLEDFRLNKLGRKWTVGEIQGHIAEFAMDQHGSRFIQQRLESAMPDEKQRIWGEILPDAYSLMTDVFGNYVVQKMFEVGTPKQRASLTGKMEKQVVYLSNHMYGCRVVQKALDYLDGEARDRVIKELEPKLLDLVVANNGNHVIQRLVAVDPPESLSKAFAGELERLATNPYACRVVQKMFEQMPEEMKRPLLDEMHPLVGTLMQDQFGNYVVQSVIVMGPKEDRARIIDHLKGSMLPMSRHKFASNVCEKALQHAEPEDRRILVDELIDAQDDDTTKIPMLLRDAFGNFPLQTALTAADDDQRAQLLDLIIPVIPKIRSTPVGKRLEGRFAHWEADGMIASATEAGANTQAYLESRALEQAEIDAIEERHRAMMARSSGPHETTDEVDETAGADTASDTSDSLSTGVTSPDPPSAAVLKPARSSSSDPNRSTARSVSDKSVWDAASGRKFEKADSMVTVMPDHEGCKGNDEKTLGELLR